MSLNKSSTRSAILCDDVLVMILCELNVRQLLCLERVSQQLMDCVGSALQKKIGLSVGDIPEDMKCMDKKHALTNGQLIGDNNSDKNILNSVFGKIFTKCPNIKSLYLPQKLTVKIMNDLQQLGLTHVIMGSIDNVSDRDSCGPNLDIDIWFISTGLPSLRRLTLCRYDRRLTQLFECLPQTIRALDLIECQKLPEAMDALVGGHGIQLKAIAIKCYPSPLFYDHVFTAICNALTLDRLSYHCSDISLEPLKCIEKQTQLKRLSLRLSEPIPMNAVDWHLLPQLRRLELHHIYTDVTTSGPYLQLLPTSVKRLSIGRLYHPCRQLQCILRPESSAIWGQCFATWLTYVPQLTQLGVDHIEYWFDTRFGIFDMNCGDFKVFNTFKCFTIHMAGNANDWDHILVANIADNLVKTRCMTNRFAIYLNKQCYNTLISHLSTCNIPIPVNYKLLFND